MAPNTIGGDEVAPNTIIGGDEASKRDIHEARVKKFASDDIKAYKSEWKDFTISGEGNNCWCRSGLLSVVVQAIGDTRIFDTMLSYVKRSDVQEEHFTKEDVQLEIREMKRLAESGEDEDKVTLMRKVAERGSDGDIQNLIAFVRVSTQTRFCAEAKGSENDCALLRASGKPLPYATGEAGGFYGQRVISDMSETPFFDARSDPSELSAQGLSCMANNTNPKFDEVCQGKYTVPKFSRDSAGRVTPANWVLVWPANGAHYNVKICTTCASFLNLAEKSQ